MQSDLIQETLRSRGFLKTKCYFAMRYWHPYTGIMLMVMMMIIVLDDEGDDDDDDNNCAIMMMSCDDYDQYSTAFRYSLYNQ